jgi:hypothetical protein
MTYNEGGLKDSLRNIISMHEELAESHSEMVEKSAVET